ncbi:hypothetical protein GCM10027610_081930 [Dactylosporangium cerinum]
MLGLFGVVTDDGGKERRVHGQMVRRQAEGARPTVGASNPSATPSPRGSIRHDSGCSTKLSKTPAPNAPAPSTVARTLTDTADTRRSLDIHHGTGVIQPARHPHMPRPARC